MTPQDVPIRPKRRKIPNESSSQDSSVQLHLADVISRSFAISTFDTQERYYLPAPCIKGSTSLQGSEGLVNKKVVERELVRAPKYNSYAADTKAELVDWIVSDASKVFAITVQCHLDPVFFLKSMINFYNSEFDDASLPIDDPRALADGDPRPPRPEAFPADTWLDQRHDEFFQFQWTCLAPVFVKEEYEYDLRSQHILPFKKAIDTNPRSGSFSSVFKVTVHEHHQERHSASEIAIKQITVQKSAGQQQTEKAWEIEARALSAINRLEHPHIMKSIAAIRRGDSRYFMFPWAEESLLDYWNATPKQAPSPELILEALNQLRGIADALDKLHNFRGGSSSDSESYRDVQIVVAPSQMEDSTPRIDEDEADVNAYRNPMSQESIRHGDLKPENILRFLDGKSAIGTLKLGDMGLAKRHVAATENRRGTSMRYGTRRYEGPETTIAKQGRSRLYDLWSMGCITFEFIIWLLYGNEALTEFWDQAEKQSKPAEFQYYKMQESGRGPRPMVHPTVVRWMNHLQKHDPECRQSSTSALKDLLAIVRDKLLVVDLPPTRGSALGEGGGGRGLPLPEFVGGTVKYRATAAEFRKALDAIKRKEKGARYIYTGQGRSAVSLPFAAMSYGSSLTPRASQHAKTSLRVDSKVNALASGVLSKKIEADYTLPPLEAWEFDVDNTFAGKATTYSEAERNLHATHHQLCGRCSKLNFWSPGFAIEYDVEVLAESAKTCDLCELLHNASSGIDPMYSEKIRFERNQSVITMTGFSFPVLSIFRSPDLFTPLDIQIGSPKLLDLEDCSSNAFFDLAHEWLKDCDENHPGCGVELAHRSPTRLIHVGTLAMPKLRLVETKHEVVHDPRYIALSHPWGDTEAYKAFTTVQNDPNRTGRDLASFKISIPYADLPKTFKNAVDCARKLNISYLWIDSICIIQGPDGDFPDEAKRMEDVYSGAYCVIAASRAGDQRDGFLGPRPQRKFVTFNQNEPFYICETIDHFNSDVIKGPLNQRGWVLQERALARRTMYFTKNQTYFECGDGVRCETLTKMHNNMADFLGDPSFPNKAMRVKSRALKIAYFQGLYKQYSRLDFTRYADRPIAIAGLEKRLQAAFNTRGRYGIFDDGDKTDNGLFHRSLLWQREQDGELLEAIKFPVERNMHVPSWSWMAYKGGIDYTDPPYQSAIWETRELLPPWTRGGYGDPNIVDEDVALAAVARDFSLAGRKQDEVKVAYDTERGSETKKVQCVIVARSIEGMNIEKRFYVLLVIPTEGETEEGHKKYKRVGAGFMLGKYITLDKAGVEVRIF